MNITCAITDGMTPQEKEIYFDHMAKRHREEAEYMEARKLERKMYKESLINEILQKKNQGGRLTREYLSKLTLRALEILTY